MLRTLLVVMLLCGRAAAQDSEADVLFEQGRVLLDAGKYPEACAKFEQSMAKDPRAVGTLMNLGLCNERSGKVATALKLFHEAFDRASEANLAGTKKDAEAEISKLSPTVPHVAVVRRAAPLPGEKLVVDDAVIPIDTKDLTLDPGPHTVTLAAPGHLPFETKLAIAPASNTTLELPALHVPAETVVTRTTSPRRTIGKVATFAGIGVVIAGSAVAYYAHRDYDKLFVDPDGSGPKLAACGAYPPIDGVPTCDAGGQSRSERDSNLSTGGFVVAGVGAAAVATGLVLWLTAPDETSQTTITPLAAPSTVGLTLSRTF